jgi:hypothetical protein
MFIEKKILNLIRPSNNLEDPMKGQNNLFQVLMYLIDVAIFIIALVVAWDCNSKVVGFTKFIFILYAGLFPSVYLSFYLVYRIVLGNACY